MNSDFSQKETKTTKLLKWGLRSNSTPSFLFRPSVNMNGKEGFEQKAAKDAKPIPSGLKHGSRPSVQSGIRQTNTSASLRDLCEILFNSIPVLRARHLLLVSCLLLPTLHAEPSRWSALWLTPDQQGQRLFKQGDYREAAEHFNDPMWKGCALYRAGEFKQAQTVFARLDTADAHFNRGNCFVLLGLYQDAVASYDRALKRRPDWTEAIDNRALAAARAAMLKSEGGDMGDQKIGADKIVFDKKKPGGQDTQVTGEQAADSSSMQALWLRRVQTRPAEFLRNKFAYQLATEEQDHD